MSVAVWEFIGWVAIAIVCATCVCVINSAFGDE